MSHPAANKIKIKIKLKIKIKVLGRLRVKRVKTCKLRVTCKTRNPHRKMYGFTRFYA